MISILGQIFFRSTVHFPTWQPVTLKQKKVDRPWWCTVQLPASLVEFRHPVAMSFGWLPTEKDFCPSLKFLCGVSCHFFALKSFPGFCRWYGMDIKKGSKFTSKTQTTGAFLGFPTVANIRERFINASWCPACHGDWLRVLKMKLEITWLCYCATNISYLSFYIRMRKLLPRSKMCKAKLALQDPTKQQKSHKILVVTWWLSSWHGGFAYQIISDTLGPCRKPSYQAQNNLEALLERVA